MLVRLSLTAATGISTTIYGLVKEAQAEDADPVVTLYRMVGLVSLSCVFLNFIRIGGTQGTVRQRAN